MTGTEDETSDSIILDLALDSVPPGTCAYLPYRAEGRPPAAEDGEDGAVGWELTRDPVYERCALPRGRKAR